MFQIRITHLQLHNRKQAAMQKILMIMLLSFMDLTAGLGSDCNLQIHDGRRISYYSESGYTTSVKSLHCRWTLPSIKANQAIVINLSSMDVERGAKCNRSLCIQEGSSGGKCIDHLTLREEPPYYLCGLSAQPVCYMLVRKSFDASKCSLTSVGCTNPLKLEINQEPEAHHLGFYSNGHDLSSPNKGFVLEYDVISCLQASETTNANQLTPVTKDISSANHNKPPKSPDTILPPPAIGTIVAVVVILLMVIALLLIRRLRSSISKRQALSSPTNNLPATETVEDVYTEIDFNKKKTDQDEWEGEKNTRLEARNLSGDQITFRNSSDVENCASDNKVVISNVLYASSGDLTPAYTTS